MLHVWLNSVKVGMYMIFTNSFRSMKQLLYESAPNPKIFFLLILNTSLHLSEMHCTFLN